MANDINKVVLIGNIVRDVELSYGKRGTAIATITIASNRSVKRGDEWESEVSYFDVALFGKSAENLKPYLIKGKKIAVEGTLVQDRWKKDGQKYSKVKIICEELELIGSKAQNQPAIESETTQMINNTNSANITAYEPNLAFEGEEFPEDIPF